MAYTAQIRIKRDGKVVYSEAETFNRKQNAATWLRNRETELDAPGALDRAIDNKAKPMGATLADAIDRYLKESAKAIGRTKEQVLKAIKRDEIAELDCRRVTSDAIVAYAQRLKQGDRSASTVGNYMSHLAAVFAIAKPAWKMDLEEAEMRKAHKVMSSLGVVSKSNRRSRRPTLEELDQLLVYFEERSVRAPKTVPMHWLIAFAIFSTRRQEEILTIKWDDYDEKHARVLVRDMKHPGQKIGNDVWCDLPPPAVEIIKLQNRKSERIFPYSTDAVSAAFTRTCLVLDIKDLHFHDLRHEGVTRLFEMGNTIPHVAAVSGHRAWASLQRYTHVKQAGDKYEDWKWLKKWMAGKAPDA